MSVKQRKIKIKDKDKIEPQNVHAGTNINKAQTLQGKPC